MAAMFKEEQSEQGLDALGYEYCSNSSRLKRVTDSVKCTNYTDHIGNQTDAENYAFHTIGNGIGKKFDGDTAVPYQLRHTKMIIIALLELSGLAKRLSFVFCRLQGAVVLYACLNGV